MKKHQTTLIARIFLLSVLFILFSIPVFAHENHEHNKTNSETVIDELMGMSLEDLMNVKIMTATRSFRKMSELPVTTFIITRDDILENNYTTLVDVFKDMPGIKVSQPGSGNLGEMFLMRGLIGNYYTKILLNGVPITPSIVKGLPISEQINMKNVERIEIAFGPASSLYGADAMAGVVNIITLSPDYNYTDISLISGEVGYQYYNLFHSHIFDVGEDRLKFIFSGSFSSKSNMQILKGHEEVYNRDIYNDTEMNPFPNNIPLKIGDIPNKNYSLNFQALYKEFSLSLDHMYRSDLSSLGLKSHLYYYDDRDAIWGEDISRFTLTHQTQAFDELSINTYISYLRYRMDNESYLNWIVPITKDGVFGEHNKAYKYEASDDITFESHWVWDISKELELVGGVVYTYSGGIPKTPDLSKPFDESLYSIFDEGQIKGDDLGILGVKSVNYSNLGGFLQAGYYSKLFAVIAGGRFDHHSDYENTFNPRVSMQYNFIENSSLRISYNQAFKAPAPAYIHEVFGVPKGDKVNYKHLPNLDLKPEKVESFEIGAKSLVSKNVSVELIGFYNKIDRLITIKNKVPVDQKLYPNSKDDDLASTWINDDDAQTTVMGVEGNIRIKTNLVKNANIGTDIYLSYNKGEETLPATFDDKGNKIIEKLDFRKMLPDFIGKIRLWTKLYNVLHINLDTIVSSSWYSREYSPLMINNKVVEKDYYNNDGYITFDLISNYELMKDVNIFFEIRNITDVNYGGIQAYDGYNLKYNPQIKRTVFGGIRTTL